MRATGRFVTTTAHGETVRTFVPCSMPPKAPPLKLDGDLTERLLSAPSCRGSDALDLVCPGGGALPSVRRRAVCTAYAGRRSRPTRTISL